MKNFQKVKANPLRRVAGCSVEWSWKRENENRRKIEKKEVFHQKQGSRCEATPVIDAISFWSKALGTSLKETKVSEISLLPLYWTSQDQLI